MLVVNQWTTELLKINNSSLGEPKFYKLRSDLYEVVARSFLDDCYDEYIQNSHNIFNMIVETNLNKENVGLHDTIRFFRDLIGLCRSISISKIFYSFAKIMYPTIEKMLEQYGPKLINEEIFLVALCDFYAMMCKNSGSKIYGQFNAIILKILRNACNLMCTLIGQFNGVADQIKDKEQLITFVSGKSKLVFRL